MPTLISRRSNKLSKSGRYWVSTKPVIQWLLSRVTQWAGRAGSESDGRHSQYLEIACQPTLWRATVKISIQLKCCVLCVKTQAGNLILKYFKFSFMMMDVFNCLTTVAATSQLGFTLGHVNISSRPACTHFSQYRGQAEIFSGLCF